MIRSCRILTVLAVLGICSCSRSGERLNPVVGKVFFKGQPATKALVIFHSRDDPDAVKARATVEKDGSFRAYTYVAADGVKAGDYDVTVVGWKKRPQRNPDKSQPKGNKEPPGIELPARYENPKTSKLRVQIIEGRNELPTFYLEPK